MRSQEEPWDLEKKKEQDPKGKKDYSTEAKVEKSKDDPFEKQQPLHGTCPPLLKLERKW